MEVRWLEHAVAARTEIYRFVAADVRSRRRASWSEFMLQSACWTCRSRSPGRWRAPASWSWRGRTYIAPYRAVGDLIEYSVYSTVPDTGRTEPPDPGTLKSRQVRERELAAVDVHAAELGAAVQRREDLAGIEDWVRVEGAFDAAAAA